MALKNLGLNLSWPEGPEMIWVATISECQCASNVQHSRGHTDISGGIYLLEFW